MATSRIFQGCLVLFLYSVYVIMWRKKQIRQIRETGHDPEVMFRDQRATQQYFSSLSRVMTIIFVVLIFAFMSGLKKMPGLIPIDFLTNPVIDLVGFVVGISGLLLCYQAQKTMGNSWRVGIDEQQPTVLITNGIYRFVRNPTYSGLFLLCFGSWLIIATMSLLVWCLILFIMIEFQVRLEEEYLLKLHGEKFKAYCQSTKRYLPCFY